MKKFKVKKVLKWVCVVLSVVATLTFINSSTDIFKKELNPDNLIDVTAEGYIKSQNTARGVEIDVDDDGIIRLYGKSTSAGSVTVATVELQPGTYTLSGVSNPNIDEFGMRVQYGSGDVAFAGTESATFEIMATETVSVIIYWADDYNFNIFTNYKVTPVLVSGDKAGSFYD